MENFAYKDIHAWKATKGYLLSYENEKRLLAFENLDSLINHLFITGEKEAARKIHKQSKGFKHD